MHEYIESYLYYSMYNDETDKHIKQIWEILFEQELSHLHATLTLVRKHENKDWYDVIPGGDYPELISFVPQKEYIRQILGNTVCNTSLYENYVSVTKLPSNANFFDYQKRTIKDVETMPSHIVIEDHIKNFNSDYRLQDKEHPVKALRDRKSDNVNIGRMGS